VDAASDCGDYGLTIIAFVGSVFSPYYAWARSRREADAENHVALNVAMYGRGGYRWSMTERGRRDLNRSADRLTIGPSSVRWSGAQLEIDIDETCVPIPRALRGRVVVTPASAPSEPFALDAARRHIWQPIAPVARVVVQMDAPKRSWSGQAYIDSNLGSEPLEAAFMSWDWSRTIERDRTRIFYDIVARDGSSTSIAPVYGSAPPSDGSPVMPPGQVELKPSLWRVPRKIRSEASQATGVLETWEDGPFYARTLVGTQIGGERIRAVHETVSLSRFSHPVVKAMLPFRMPRWAR